MSDLDYQFGNDFFDPTPVFTAARSERTLDGPVPPVTAPESDPMTREEFGRRFAAARKARGLTQTEVAAAIGVPRSTTTRYAAQPPQPISGSSGRNNGGASNAGSHVASR